MLNYLWLAMLLIGVFVAGWTGNVRPAVEAAIKGAETAVTLALGLVGIMSLWLGIMRLADRAGLVSLLARAMRPLLSRLFPDVPSGHPALASMTLNIAANMLGLTNAATPFGLRAMRDLESLNQRPGTATNAMCTFLAINTGSVQLLPATGIALLAAAGSVHPTAIVGTALLATVCSSLAGLIAVKTCERLPIFRVPPVATGAPSSPSPTPAPTNESPVDTTTSNPPPLQPWSRAALALVGLGFLTLIVLIGFPEAFGRPPDPNLVGRGAGLRLLEAISLLAIPFLLAFFPLYASLRQVAVYEEFVEGAREGFQVALRIIPFLVGMLVAIGLLRGSGSIEFFTEFLRTPLETVGFPPEILPLALIRPFSGSASLAVFGDLIQTFGPDSLIARTAGTLIGSTETTFYVIAVYFGAVAVRRVRHAVVAGLAADATGVIAAVLICRVMFP